MCRVLGYLAGPKTQRSSLTDSITDGNLYVGTSVAEILHFVSLPIDPTDDKLNPTFILASRLQPSGHSTPSSSQAPGIRRILLLPGPAKACVLCNGVVSFYSLPELSPAFPSKEPSGVQWIGGIDGNEDLTDEDGQVIMIANSKRILLVRVGERLKPVKISIEYSNCLVASRRGTIACVADQYAYALVEVEHRQKIPLFPISSDDNLGEVRTGLAEESKSRESVRLARSSSLAHQGTAANEAQGHSRSTSLGTFVSGINRRQPSPRAESQTRTGQRVPGTRPGSTSPAAGTSQQTSGVEPLASIKSSAASRRVEGGVAESIQKPLPAKPRALLQPHIVSLSSTEFLLTTGTGDDEPGVGLFVNLDGDVVRSTIEFERYPSALVMDRPTSDTIDTRAASRTDEDANILALLTRTCDGLGTKSIQVQNLSPNLATMAKSTAWIDVPCFAEGDPKAVGLCKLVDFEIYNFFEVGCVLKMVRLRFPSRSPPASTVNADPSDPQHNPSLEEDPIPAWEVKRNREEATFARRLGIVRSDIVTWSNAHIWCLLRNPLVLQLEALLTQAQRPQVEGSTPSIVNGDPIGAVLRGVRNMEARTEVDFLSLNYVRQKASLLLFINLFVKHESDAHRDTQLQAVQSALEEGGLDPRVIMCLIPMLQIEVLQGPQGLWVYGGLASLVEDHIELKFRSGQSATVEFWMMIKRFLTSWQGKRGFGSIADEQYVFDSVDTALLHVLLHLEDSLPQGSTAISSIRAKLNNVVDNWKGNFDRAVQLLEEYHRLYVLSRLYQTKVLARDVLGTWRRIAEGEYDAGSEVSPVVIETQVRRYLDKIRDAQLVEEYGVWLAQRNADLAIQFFTDDTSKVKFSPQQTIALLKKEVPGAVQHYLEHLVFHKQMSQYGDDLIGYYLDSVLTILEHSREARDTLAHSYSTYRALRSPKPTYLTFITENAAPDAWWHARLRLLELLGGHSYATTSTAATRELSYSVPAVLERLAPFSSFLVSESIILDARQGRHKEALRLLTHGLGDYDTAIRYCYFGTPSPASIADTASLPSDEAQRDLFGYLLREFLLIEDISERLERTSSLIGKFAAWFDPRDMMDLIPDSWTMDLLSEFFLHTFRTLTSERNETILVKALSTAQNLRTQAYSVDMEKFGARTESRDQPLLQGADCIDQSVGISQDTQ